MTNLAMTNLNDIDRRLAEARARHGGPPPAVHEAESGAHFGRMWRPALRYARSPGAVPAHEAEAIRAAFEPVLLYVLLVLVAGGLYGFSQGGGGRAAGFALIALAAGLSVPLLTALLGRANHGRAGHGSGSAGEGHGERRGHEALASESRAPLAAAPVAPEPLAAAPVAASPAKAPAESVAAVPEAEVAAEAAVAEAPSAETSPEHAVPSLDAVESGIARLEATIAAGKPKRSRKAAAARAPEEASLRGAKRKTVTVSAAPETRPAGERAL